MTVEEWLADLEDRADAAIEFSDNPFRGILFANAASPAAVKRLVEMVRLLAVGCDCDAEICWNNCTPACRITMAYQQTEPTK